MDLRAIAKIEYGGMKPAHLRAIRERLNLSQVGLAKRLGVAGPTVNRWERGARRIPVSVERFLYVMDGGDA